MSSRIIEGWQRLGERPPTVDAEVWPRAPTRPPQQGRTYRYPATAIDAS
jgi:hypothetical protein